VNVVWEARCTRPSPDRRIALTKGVDVSLSIYYITSRGDPNRQVVRHAHTICKQ
jgi:hypothetical protein